jgi:hypothetical protein
MPEALHITYSIEIRRANFSPLAAADAHADTDLRFISLSAGLHRRLPSALMKNTVY